MNDRYTLPLNADKYPCIVPGCPNMIIFTEKDRAFFVKMGFVNDQGQVTKPRKCKRHREEAKRQVQVKPFADRESRFNRDR